MKLFVALVLALAGALLFSTPALAVERGEIIKNWVADRRAITERGGKQFDWTVTDTGDQLDSEEGEWPIVDVVAPRGQKECLVAVHPSAQKSIILICTPLPPKTGV